VITFILLIAALVTGIFWGRIVEASKRSNNKPTAFRTDLEDRQGYMRGRLNIDLQKVMTLDEILLALHRTEGTLGAINDNFSDLTLQVKKYDDQETKTDA